ncbi:MAG: cell division protein [Salibacteraceae bacterium]
MPQLELTTRIAAPQNRCFNLCRSIDLLCDSISPNLRQPRNAPASGLVVVDQIVELDAMQWGYRWVHRSKITALETSYHFQDIMVSGPFKAFTHDHYFEANGAETLMRDRFFYELPFGWLGKAANDLVAQKTLRALLERRNRALKATAETEAWKSYL